ncbi:MAG: thiamine-phosphate kinase [Candidatus Omnitrophica bacterium]|nr:thiamine-phosphate kinase [Candidatus Omnitrophota bacterium]
MKLKDVGEIGLIKGFARTMRLDGSVVKGSGDDAAVIKWTRSKYLLLTCDMVVEDVHFKLRDALPFDIGWKAMARNISDIAAMGGLPRYALVSVAIDPGKSVSFARELVKGMNAAASRFNVNIVGGDMSRSKSLMIDISLAGEVEKRNVVLRSGAKPGDLILVTGSIGGSGKGRHLNFIPRVSEAREIVKRFKVNSMIDISDGLVMDLWRILDASKAGATLYQNAIPLSKDAGSFKKAISEGEDFELLFTMKISEAKRFFKTYLGKMKTPVTLIGEITEKKNGYKLVNGQGKEEKLGPRGYAHF